MSVTWAILVWNYARTTRRHAYGPRTEDALLHINPGPNPRPATAIPLQAAPINEITANLTPNGNALNMTWEGDATQMDLDINAGDLIELYLPQADGTLGLEYTGEATHPTNALNSDGELHPYQADSLDRFLEQIDTGTNYEIPAGTDLADAARSLLENSTLHESLRWRAADGENNLAAIPATLGVLNAGAINPSSVDLANNLEALRGAAAGGGVEVAYGVTPDRYVFFRPVNTSALTARESDLDTTVEWGEPVSPTIVTGVRWHMGAASARRGLFAEPATFSTATEDQITHLSLAPAGLRSAHGTRIPIRDPKSDPLYPLQGVTYSLLDSELVASWVGNTQDATPTLTRIADSNSASYVTLRTTGDSVFVRIMASIPAGIRLSDIVAITLTMGEDQASSVDWANHFVQFRAKGNTALTARNYIILSRDPAAHSFFYAEGPAKVDDLTISWGDRLRAPLGTNVTDDSTYVELRIGVDTEVVGEENLVRVNVEDFRIWVLDRKMLDGMAEGEYRTPEPHAFRLTKEGNHPLRGVVHLSTLDGGTITNARVSEITKHVSGTRGIETTYTVGSFVDPDELDAAVEYKQRDARARALAYAASVRRRR